jgi:hypothetical protein
LPIDNHPEQEASNKEYEAGQCMCKLLKNKDKVTISERSRMITNTIKRKNINICHN